jgi:O-antigen/teichoic acid export membrane protein
MTSLRSNVLVSTAAMVLVGVIRPGFHAVVNRTFGPEVNGRAAAIIAIIFLASLPATAALPTVMVRHLSRALGAGNQGEAVAHARLASVTSLLLTLLAIGAAIAYGLAETPPLSALDLLFVALGLFAYTYWRLYRTLLLAIGEAVASLKAELVAVLAMAIGLASAVAIDRSEWVVGAFVLVYLAFVPLTLSKVMPYLGRGKVDAEAKREFVRYNLYWFVSSGASLGAREIAVLLLDERVPRALVGEIAVALSLLMLLAFAPRVIELPLVHELSALAGKNEEARQKRLTETALHWMTVFTFAIGCGVAILAAPILAIVGDVHSTVVAHAFALIALAFMLEMIVTPAANLMIASAHPGVFAVNGAVSLAIAYAWWYSPWGDGAMGVSIGLALSHAVRAMGIAAYAKLRFGLELLRQPVKKILGCAIGLGLLGLTVSQRIEPWLAFVVFEAAMAVAFADTVRQVVVALMKKGDRGDAAEGRQQG